MTTEAASIEFPVQRELYEADPFIQTFTGQHFRLHNPVFVDEDIAHALSLLCRYNGHCREFYSVAQHSVMVSNLMEWVVGGDPLEGLLHDAGEAYLSDIPSPFKSLLPDWRLLERDLEAKLRAHYHLEQDDKTPACSLADTLALFIEARALMPDEGRCFHGWDEWQENLKTYNVEHLIQGFRAWPPHYAEGMFLRNLRRLNNPDEEMHYA